MQGRNPSLSKPHPSCKFNYYHYLLVTFVIIIIIIIIVCVSVCLCLCVCVCVCVRACVGFIARDSSHLCLYAYVVQNI